MKNFFFHVVVLFSSSLFNASLQLWSNWAVHLMTFLILKLNISFLFWEIKIAICIKCEILHSFFFCVTNSWIKVSVIWFDIIKVARWQHVCSVIQFQAIGKLNFFIQFFCPWSSPKKFPDCIISFKIYWHWNFFSIDLEKSHISHTNVTFGVCT